MVHMLSADGSRHGLRITNCSPLCRTGLHQEVDSANTVIACTPWGSTSSPSRDGVAETKDVDIVLHKVVNIVLHKEVIIVHHGASSDSLVAETRGRRRDTTAR